ncbi:hypothetical protein AAE478_009549 [Parahypoxylon ruwenzoriense]
MGISLICLLPALLGVTLAGPDATTTSIAVSTVTGYAHPLSLTPLTTLGAHQTPLSYAEPPTAITVPTKRPPPFAVAAETSTPAEGPSDPAPTKVCTTIKGAYPTATLPNFCAPSALVNAPTLGPARADLPTATVTVGGVSNKLDCCVQCAGIFNCVAWRFLPVYTQPPNAHLPGGFDPWGRGDCEAVYHTGDPSVDGAETESDGGVPNLCPNGNVGEMLATASPENGTEEATGGWSALYYDGWNEGPCGAPVAVFESAQDPGMGDKDKLCP